MLHIVLFILFLAVGYSFHVPSLIQRPHFLSIGRARTQSVGPQKKSGMFSRKSDFPLDDANWKVFCDALLAIDFNSEVWNLPNNPVNKGDTTIYILPIYRTLLNHTELSPLNNPNSLVLGQPGIGKSTFSIPIMKQRMMQGRPFFFTHPDSIEVVVWRPIEGPTVIPFASLAAVIRDRNMLWIMNQEEHGAFRSASCDIVLLSSPKESNYKGYKKQFKKMLATTYMPLPSEEEIIAIAATANITDENEVRRRISIVGRIPRSVCARNFDSEIQDINEALATCSFNANIFDSKVISSGNQELRSCIFAVDADENFRKKRDEFVSDIVCNWYMHAWQEKNREEFKKFIATDNNIAGMGTIYGNAFEIYAHELLRAGGVFSWKVLEDKTEGKPEKVITRRLVIPSRPEAIVPNKVQFVDGHIGHYLRPSSGNFGAVDSLALNEPKKKTTVVDLYQITSDQNHGINSSELKQLIDKILAFYELPPASEGNASEGNAEITIRFMFVVPGYLFDRFKLQSYDKGGLDLKYKKYIEQSVIGLETHKGKKAAKEGKIDDMGEEDARIEEVSKVTTTKQLGRKKAVKQSKSASKLQQIE
jgi:hypothetical protein